MASNILVIVSCIILGQITFWCHPLRENLEGRVASPGRIDQPNDALTLAGCVKKMRSKKRIGSQKWGKNIGRMNRQNDA
jgi:hypothetical protein